VGYCLLCSTAFGSVGAQSFVVVSSPPSSQAFSSVGATMLPGPEAGSGATVSWPVEVNVPLLATLPATLPVNLPDRALISFSRVRSERRGSSTFVWMGKGADCTALFSIAGNDTRATISCLEGQYGINHPAGSSAAYLSRYDNSAYASENEPPQSPTPGPLAASVAGTTSSDTTVDVLVLFPANATGNIWATAQYCIDQTQLALISSTSPGHATIAQLRLAAAARTSRISSDDVPGDLGFVLNSTEALNLRNYWAADAVVFISNGSGLPGTALGQAQVPGYELEPLPGPAFANHAAAAVLRSFATQEGQYVFAHELAHTFGANHNQDHLPANTTPLEPYAFGRWARNNAKGTGARTIMSYVQECTGSPCPRILNYSNPDVYYDWFRTGLPLSANNAGVLQEIAPIEAQYRASVGRIFADGFQ